MNEKTISEIQINEISGINKIFLREGVQIDCPIPPIINWGKYREENGRLMMPVSVRLNHAIADGYLIANVFRLLDQEISDFVRKS